MDLVRLIVPNDDVRELMPLAALGYVDTTLTDDILLKNIQGDESNLLGHLRLSFKEYEDAHPNLRGSPLIVLDLLKVCLDKRIESENECDSKFLTKTVPIILAYTILGVSFFQPLHLIPLQHLETVLKASVAVTLRCTPSSKKPQLQVRLAPRENEEGGASWLLALSELTMITLLLINSVANVVLNSNTEPSLSFYLSLALQPDVHESIAAAARYVLEVWCSSPNIKAQLILSDMIETRIKKSGLNNRTKSLPILFKTKLPALQQVLFHALLKCIDSPVTTKTSSYLSVMYDHIPEYVEALGLGSWSFTNWLEEADVDGARSPLSRHMQRCKIIRGRQSSLRSTLKLPLHQALSGAMSTIHDMIVSSRVTYSVAALLPKICFGLIYSYSHASDDSVVSVNCLMDLITIAREYNLWRDQGGVEVLNASISFMNHLDYSRLELPIAEVINTTLSAQLLPLSLRKSLLELCARSFWSCVNQPLLESDSGLTQTRLELFKAVDKDLIRDTFIIYKLQSPTGKSDSLVGMIEESESLERVEARHCVGHLFTIFGSELLFANIEECKLVSLNTFDVVHATDFVIDSGLYLVEAFAINAGCLGGCDLTTWYNRFLPNLQYCQQTRVNSKTTSTPITDVCARIEFLFRSSLTAFLINRTINSESPYIKLIIEQLDGCCDNVLSITSLANLLRWFCKDLARSRTVQPSVCDAIIDGTWQPIFSWAQKVFVEGSKQGSSEMISASRDLLTTICGIIPNQFTEQLYALLLQQQNALEVQLANTSDASVSLQTSAMYCVYVELLAIHMEEKIGSLSIQMVEQIIAYSVNKLGGYYNLPAGHQSVSFIRAWSHVLIQALEACSSSHTNTLLPKLELVLESLYSWRSTTDVTLWKTRMQVWEAVLKEVDRQLSVVQAKQGDGQVVSDSIVGKRHVLMQFLIQGPIVEACLKTASLTGVTRRRSRRCLTLLFEIVRKIEEVEQFCSFLAVGLSSTESVNVQRGFANAAEYLLGEQQEICGEIRGGLELILSLTKPICFNLDKKSTRSSRLASQFTSSTKRSIRSRRSIKSQYKPLRA